MVCAALVCVLSAQGQAVRQMYLYAVKGADSLYLDRYEAVPAVSGARPCMIFVFGGGFVDGTRDVRGMCRSSSTWPQRASPWCPSTIGWGCAR